MKNFESMDLFAPLKRALAEQKYHTPTPIQAQTIPAAIAGQDILGCAQTGTGKTAAFALPILDYLGQEEPRTEPNRPVALILAPTRELAIQIGESFRVYGQHMRFTQALVYGGVNQDKQVRALRQGVDVVIATPGRLMDLMQQGHISLGNIEIFVLDEADRMLDMGFLPDLKKIVAKLPKQRQSLFFSATMPAKARELSNQLLFNPVSVNVTPKSPSVVQIEQKIMMLDRGAKLSTLQKLLAQDSVERTIVFTRTKRGANTVATKLERAGIRAAAIHGNKSQNARQRALDAFRQNHVRVLVATDVAARGIDIDGVSHVINYDMPVEAESYVHRIGRTGRAGAEGIAISFCTSDEKAELIAIERLIDKRLPVEHVAGSGPAREDRNGQSRSSTARPRQRSSANSGGRPASQGRSRRRRGSSAKAKARVGAR